MKMFACTRTVEYFKDYAVMRASELCFVTANSNEEARGFAHNDFVEKHPEEKGYFNHRVVHVAEVPKQTEE